MLRLIFTALFAASCGYCYAGDSEPRVVISKFNYHGDTLYDSVEVMPVLPSAQLNGFLAKTLRYPDEARMNGAEGKVYLGFVIDTAGAVGTALVTQSSGNAYLDAEALRVVRLMPRFEPGKHEGKPVNVFMEFPISFSLH